MYVLFLILYTVLFRRYCGFIDSILFCCQFVYSFRIVVPCASGIRITPIQSSPHWLICQAHPLIELIHEQTPWQHMVNVYPLLRCRCRYRCRIGTIDLNARSVLYLPQRSPQKYCLSPPTVVVEDESFSLVKLLLILPRCKIWLSWESEGMPITRVFG